MCEWPGFALRSPSPVPSLADMCVVCRNPPLVHPSPCSEAGSTTLTLVAGLCHRAAGGWAGSPSYCHEPSCHLWGLTFNGQLGTVGTANLPSPA